MGSATALIGILPTYTQIGFWAPILLFTLRLAQGLALGGEYGGAATYVAEHAPANKRGAFTSWIQITATLGLFLSLAVILTVRHFMSSDSFSAWGWRVPFGVSVILLGVSVYIRLKLEESPVFAEMKAQGKNSKSPLTESFGNKENLVVVLKALFGATAGQGVVWYAGQFYALYFLTTTLKVNYIVGYELIAVALIIGTPFLLFFGSLSDKIGRKWLILSGMLLTVLTYQPIFHGLTEAANPALARAMKETAVTLHTEDFNGNTVLVIEALADAARKIVLPSKIKSTTDQARNYLNTRGVPFTLDSALPGQPISLTLGSSTIQGFDKLEYEKNLVQAGYPLAADSAQINWFKAISLLTLLVIYVALVYGPIAAFLVELFPTRIRYTSMSLPYHIGNGWFGGFLPLIATSISVFTGNIYAGLWYPITIAGLCFIIGALVLPETKNRDISKDNY